MAFFEVIKGGSRGQRIELASERMVLGRHPTCEIVLEDAAISRHHARILENHGAYFIEDLRSRNHTFLNGQQVDGRTELFDGDLVKVCGVQMRFHMQSTPPRGRYGNKVKARIKPRGRPATPDQKTQADGFPSSAERGTSEIDPDDTSSIISTLDAASGSSMRLHVKPEAKLRAILEISNALAKLLSISQVVHSALDGLFKLFPQADEGFGMLKEREGGKLVLRGAKSRNRSEGDEVQVSMTIVQHAIDTGQAILSGDVGADDRFQSGDSVSNLRLRSMMCVPLARKGSPPLGVLHITTSDLRNQFTDDDLDMLVSVASQVTLAVENAVLHEDSLEQRDLQRDLDFATQVQLGFLPSTRPKLPGYEFCDYYEAALRVGGDYFDYVQLPDKRVVVALGDVAGKGIPAALLMARLYPTARFHFLTHPQASDAMKGLNSEIACGGVGHRFITFVLAIVDPASHEVTVVNAGHWPPLLRRKDGTVEEIGRRSSGMPLGVIRDQEFNEAKFVMEPGDVVTLFTDGVSEAVDPSGDAYGTKRLSEFLAAAPLDAGKLVEGIVADVEKFSKKEQQKDDMCLVCFRRCE